MKIVFVIVACFFVLTAFAERIAIYSGTFDPPHLAHQKIVEEILAKDLADKVIVVPDDQTNFKPDKLPFQDRLNMVKLMFEGNPNVTFFTESMQKKLPSGEIWNVLNVVRESYPKDELMWAMGRDTFDKYPRFAHNFENKNFSLVVMERGNATKLPPSMNGQKIQSVSFDMSEISSTEVRESLEKGERPRHLSESVFNYITRNGLYRSQIPLKNTSCFSRALDQLLAVP